jgi:signal transduction histidine kinase
MPISDVDKRHATYVNIRIRDTGCGMTPNVLSRTCEPFYTTKQHGIGLGLPVVRHFVENLDGRLEIDSVADVGTNVTLLLPSQQAITVMRESLARARPSHHEH